MEVIPKEHARFDITLLALLDQPFYKIYARLIMLDAVPAQSKVDIGKHASFVLDNFLTFL